MKRPLRLFLSLPVLCISIHAQAFTPIPVRVAAVGRSTAAIPVEAIGYLSRQVEAPLAFKVAGMVDEVLVRAGDTVKRGQLLARLRLDEIEAQLEQARSHAEKTRRDWARREQLKSMAVATLEELENARTALDLAEAQLRVAEFNRRCAEIIAPDDGAILGRMAEPDQWASAGQTIVYFGSERHGWRVKAQVAAVDVRRLQVGDRAEVEGTGGVISNISEAADPITRTVGVEVSCLQRPANARSNRVVLLTLRPQPVQERPALPVSSLIAGDGGLYRVFVLVAGSDVVRRLQVEVGTLHNDVAYLRTAMPVEFVRVVTQGAEYLRDGMKVLVVE